MKWTSLVKAEIESKADDIFNVKRKWQNELKSLKVKHNWFIISQGFKKKLVFLLTNAFW